MQKSASTQSRKSHSKFESDSIHLFIRLLRPDRSVFNPSLQAFNEKDMFSPIAVQGWAERSSRPAEEFRAQRRTSTVFSSRWVEWLTSLELFDMSMARIADFDSGRFRAIQLRFRTLSSSSDGPHSPVGLLFQLATSLIPRPLSVTTGGRPRAQRQF